MKLKKLLVFTLMTSVFVIATTGCTLFKPTTESLSKKYNSTFENIKTADFTVDYDIKFNITNGESGFDMGLKGNEDVDLLIDKDKTTAHSVNSATMTMFDMSETVKNDNYIVEENGESTVYTKTEEQDWVKSTSEDNMATMLIKNNKINETFKMEDKTTTYNDVECYVLKGKIKSTDVLGSDFEDETSMEFDDIDLDVDIYMDKKTKNVIGMQYSISKEAFAEALKKEDTTESASSVELNSFVIKISINDINNDVKIDIPEEALNAKSAETVDENMTEEENTTIEKEE